jgi:hypothetical protein
MMSAIPTLILLLASTAIVNADEVAQTVGPQNGTAVSRGTTFCPR